MSETLDPARLAEQSAILEGELAAESLERIVVVSPGARMPVGYRLAFSRRRDGPIVIDLSVRTCLPLRCERCLGPIEWSVESGSLLAVCFGDDQTRELPDTLEPVVTDESGRLSLKALVEDEILMALPLAPRHAGACGASLREHDPEMVAAASREDSPFAALAALKSSKN
ncbi:MAG: YceD family protein [Halothiobacillaceae bacterium]